MRFKPYPKYKPSGVEWLGDVPEGWGVQRLKWSVAHSKGGVWGDEPAGDSNDMVCLRVADFDRKKFSVDVNNLTVRNISTSEQNGRVLAFGDLLLEKSGGGENQPVGAVAQFALGFPAVCSNFINRLVPSEIGISNYFKYVHASLYALRLTTRSINQTSGIQNLDSYRYLCEAVGFPPVDEQTQIAKFLDRETAKIDILINKQEMLIELLKEKRQAVISHAVTKGLDSTVPTRDSGVEWLGDVPEHWEVCGFTKYLGPIVDYRGRTPTKIEDGVLLVTARNIKNGRLDYEASQEFIHADEYPLVMQRGKPLLGDVLFTMEAPLGQVANIDRVDIALAQRIVKFRGLPNHINNYYLKYWIMGTSCQCQLEQLGTGSTAIGIKSSKLGQIQFCFPEIDEQEEIVRQLDHTSLKIDTLIAKAEQAIALQKEHRTALISAAVTGKIDVRNEVLATKAA